MTPQWGEWKVIRFAARGRHTHSPSCCGPQIYYMNVLFNHIQSLYNVNFIDYASVSKLYITYILYNVMNVNKTIWFDYETLDKQQQPGILMHWRAGCVISCCLVLCDGWLERTGAVLREGRVSHQDRGKRGAENRSALPPRSHSLRYTHRQLKKISSQGKRRWVNVGSAWTAVRLV